MNETLKVLESRRSCRNFKPDMIPKEDLAPAKEKRSADPRPSEEAYYGEYREI